MSTSIVIEDREVIATGSILLGPGDRTVKFGTGSDYYLLHIGKR